MASLGDLYNDLKTLCKQWFYDKTEADGRFSPKKLSDANYFVLTDSSKELTTQQKLGNIDKNGAIGGTANLPLITTSSGVITTGSFGNGANTFCEGNDSRLSDARTPLSHNQATSTIIEASALSNIGTSADANQHTINQAIDTLLGTLSNMDFLVFTTDKGTATADKMGKLYVVNENSKVNFYYVKQTGTGTSATYDWEKMDIDILDELIVNWSDIQNNPFSNASPSDYATSTHTHGNIQNDGSIDSSSSVSSATNTNAPLIVKQGDDYEIAYGVVSAGFIKDVYAHSNIGSSSQDSQATINGLIDTALDTKITKSSSATGLLKDDGTVMTGGTGSTNWAIGNHSHNYLTSDGKITQTITNNGNLVVTNSSNQVGVQSAIDVLDGVVNQLITYGSS